MLPEVFNWKVTKFYHFYRGTYDLCTTTFEHTFIPLKDLPVVKLHKHYITRSCRNDPKRYRMSPKIRQILAKKSVTVPHDFIVKKSYFYRQKITKGILAIFSVADSKARNCKITLERVNVIHFDMALLQCDHIWQTFNHLGLFWGSKNNFPKFFFKLLCKFSML